MKKIKLLLTALLISILPILTTSCEDKKDTTIYPYTMSMMVTDKGDLNADQKMLVDTYIYAATTGFGIKELEKSFAEEKFHESIGIINKDLQQLIGKHTKKVVIKFELFNKKTRNNDFSTDIVLMPN